MGSSCGLCFRTRKALGSGKCGKIVQVERLDGKVLEFSVPILVKELLIKFPGAGVGLSKDSQDHLALTYELKLGKMYYILPPTPKFSPERESTAVHKEQGSSGVTRIKLVITKRQLEELLLKQISVEDVLKERKAEIQSPGDPLTYQYWRPELQSIPEEED